MPGPLKCFVVSYLAHYLSGNVPVRLKAITFVLRLSAPRP